MPNGRLERFAPLAEAGAPAEGHSKASADRYIHSRAGTKRHIASRRDVHNDSRADTRCDTHGCP